MSKNKTTKNNKKGDTIETEENEIDKILRDYWLYLIAAPLGLFFVLALVFQFHSSTSYLDKICACGKRVDDAKPFALIYFYISTLNLMIDVGMAYTYYLNNQLLLTAVGTGFIILPWICNVIYSFKKRKIWDADRDVSFHKYRRVIRFFDKYLYIFYLLLFISGDFYATVALFNSRIGGWKLFYIGLTFFCFFFSLFAFVFCFFFVCMF